MATACLNKNGSSKGPSSINQFHCVAQLGYGTRYNFGYPMYYRYYVRCSACATANFATSLKTSWGNTSVRLSGVGDFASTGWKSLGNKTCGTGVTLSAAWAKYTGGSGTTYNSASSSGSWTVPKASHTVAYNMNGGTGTIASQTKTYGAAITLSTTKPTKTGYVFSKWNTAAAGTGTNYVSGASYRADQWGGTVTLYAQYTANTVKIAYNSNGGTVSAANYGYNDYGWIAYNGETYFHTIDYGASDDPYNATTFGLTKTGYTFNGNWYLYNQSEGVTSTGLNQDTSYGSTTYYDYSDKTKTTANTATVYCWVYAGWTANTYTITFDPNEGTSGSTTSVTPIYGTTNYYSYGTIVPSRTGYNFKGFYTAKSGGVQVYNSSGVCVNGTGYWSSNKWVYAGNVTLYAQWTAWTHTVTYNGNADGVTNLPANQTKTYGSTITIPSGASGTPVRAGYLFQGWATSSTGAVIYKPGDTYGADQNGGTVTLYAVWLVATKIEMNLTANSGGYTISNTDAGVASLPDLTVDFTLTTVSENANLSFYYKPFYYTKENVKMYFFSDVQGGQTPSNMANKGSFVLTGTQIKEYILATENCKNIVLGVDTWTAEIVEDTYKVANSSSYSVAINNYTLPVVDILTAHRTSTSAIKVRVQVDYPACYSINTSTCKPVLTFNDSSISTAPSGAEKFDTRVIYTYNLDSLSGAGLLKASYTDGLFSDESIRRIAATLEEQEFEIQEDIIYALEFIEN